MKCKFKFRYCQLDACFSGESDVKPASNVHSDAAHNDAEDELGDVESRGEGEGSRAATAFGCTDWTEHHGSGKILRIVFRTFLFNFASLCPETCP